MRNIDTEGSITRPLLGFWAAAPWGTMTDGTTTYGQLISSFFFRPEYFSAVSEALPATSEALSAASERSHLPLFWSLD